MVLVDFDQKNWFWSNLAGKTATANKLVLVNFGRKKWFWLILTEKNWFWTWKKTGQKTGFGPKKNWCQSKKLIFDQKKIGFEWFWPKKIIWGHLGFPNEFLNFKLNFNSWIQLLVPPEFEPGSSSARDEHVAPRPRPISDVKPGQAQLILRWATT